MAADKEEMMKIDRLSALPDNILHKIQSFLHLKQAVQTCVLSKRWEKLWTSLPDINFHGQPPDFTYPTFSKFITKFLSARKDCNVGKFRIFSIWPLDSSLLCSVIEYAASHHVKHFKFHHPIFLFDSLWLSPKLLLCSDSVKSLELAGVPFGALPDSFTFNFSMLTTLSLHHCSFSYLSDFVDAADPFAGCPNLKHLSLENCDFPCLKDPRFTFSNLFLSPSEPPPVVQVFKISGPQLLSLQIHLLDFGSASAPNDYLRIQIVAPKLEYLGYMNIKPIYFYGHNLFSLERANVNVRVPPGIRERGTFGEKEKVALDLIKMFNGLHNAQFVKLTCTTIEALDVAPGLLEKQPSPFNRLKSLGVLCRSKSFNMPGHVKTYLLGGSPNAEPIQLKFMEEEEKDKEDDEDEERKKRTDV